MIDIVLSDARAWARLIAQAAIIIQNITMTNFAIPCAPRFAAEIERFDYMFEEQ